MLDQQWIFSVPSRTLLINVLWRQSMLQINGCGGKSNAYSLHAYHLIREFAQWCLDVLERFGIMMDTQAIDVVTFDFKGTHVLWVVSGSTGNQMIFV